MLPLLTPILGSFADAFGLMEPFYEDLAETCLIIFDVLQLFTFTLAFLGLLLTAYKGMVGGSFDGAFTQIMYTGIVCVIMPFFPEWLVEEVRVALSDDLLEALEVDPLSLMENFGASFGDLDVDMDAGGLIGLFIDPLAIIDYIANIIAAFCMIIIGIICYFIFFFVYQVQILALYIGAAASPIFFGMFLLEEKRETAMSYFTGLIAICMWPLGWGIGLLLADFLLQVGIDITVVICATLNLAGFGLIIEAIAIFCIVIAVATWIMFVIFGAPKIIHKAIVSGTQIGLGFAGQATSAAMAGVGAGVSMASSAAGMVPVVGGAASSAISAGGGAVTGVGNSIGGMASGMEAKD